MRLAEGSVCVLSHGLNFNVLPLLAMGSHVFRDRYSLIAVYTKMDVEIVSSYLHSKVHININKSQLLVYISSFFYLSFLFCEKKVMYTTKYHPLVIFHAGHRRQDKRRASPHEDERGKRQREVIRASQRPDGVD